jgi:hypothetical protein
VTKRAVVHLWCAICLTYVAAAGVQVLMYAPPMWGGQPIWGTGSPFGPAAHYLYTPLVLIFICGPGLVGAAVALRMLYRTYAAADRRPPKSAVFVVVVLAVVSAYAGVVVSFNTWGT